MSKTPVTFDSYKDFKGYVINLDRERWRYDVTSKLLSEAGFTALQRLSAVDYTQVDVNTEMRRLGNPKLQRFKNDAELAVALSHMRAMYTFLASADEYCFIFEDDIVLTENFHQHTDFKDINYGDFELLCFGGVYIGPTETHGIPNWTHESAAKLKHSENNNLSYADDVIFLGAHAYMLSRKGAYTLLRDYGSWLSAEDYRYPHIDRYISSNRNIRSKLIVHKPTNTENYLFNDIYNNFFRGLMWQRKDFKSTITDSQLKTFPDKPKVTFDSYKDIKGYVINLDRESARYDNAHRVLSELGFSNIHRWTAVDAKKTDMLPLFKELGIFSFDKFGQYTIIGQWACALSHLHLLKNFLASGDPYCLVFEDDVIAHTEFHNHKDFPDISWGDFDLLSFGGIFADCVHNNVKYYSVNETRKAQQHQSHVTNAHYWQTHAYLCSREFAEKAVRKYSDWVNASTQDHTNNPYIDRYYTESGYFETKLIAIQNSGNFTDLRLHQAFGHKLCGILYQDNNFKSTIQTY